MAKIFILLANFIWLGAASPAVKVTVTPSATFHPGAVRVTARIVPDERNRHICIGYDGPSYRRSCDPIEGAERKVTFEQTYKSIPPGEYHAFAELFQVLPNKAIHVETAFKVLGDEPDP